MLQFTDDLFYLKIKRILSRILTDASNQNMLQDSCLEKHQKLMLYQSSKLQ